MIKKILILFILTLGLFNLTFAADPWFEIIPWSDNSNLWTMVKNVWKWWKVWDNYKDQAYGETTTVNGKTSRVWSSLTLWDQFASGIMTWDTLLDYVVYLIKFIWQLALLAWAAMIIFYGYKKSTEHFKLNGTIGKVVIWILVISFAYVIVKIIWSMFIS